MEQLEFSDPPTVRLEADIEELAGRLADLPDNDVIAFLHRLIIKLRTRKWCEKRLS